MKKSRLLIAAALLAPILVIAGCAAGGSGSVQAASASVGQAAASSNGRTAAGSTGQSTTPSTGRAGAGGQTAAGAAGGRRFATIPVQAVTVRSGPLVTDNDTAGTVTPVIQSQVAAQVSGVVLKLLHKAGDFVREGAAVLQIDDAALKLAARNAQATLDNARINLAMGQQTTTSSNPKLSDQLRAAQDAETSAQKTYDSQKALYDLGGVSSSQLDNAKSSLDQAQANVEAARAALDQNTSSDTQTIAQLKLAVDQATNSLAITQLSLQNATIRAPFAGQIASINVAPGGYVSLNTSAFLLVSADKQINFTEPPTDAPNFRVGDTVTFSLGGKSYQVKIVQAPSAPINGVVPMVASVPASLPVDYGSVGTVTYTLTIATGPQIPISALQSRATINFVDTVVNGKAVEVPIVIVAEAGATAVVQGLNEGDQVIINPPPGLLNGATVQVVVLPTAQGQGGGQQPATTARSGQGTQAGAQGTGGKTGSQTGKSGGQRTGNTQGQQGGTGSGPTQPAAGVKP